MAVWTANRERAAAKLRFVEAETIDPAELAPKKAALKQEEEAFQAVFAEALAGMLDVESEETESPKKP